MKGLGQSDQAVVKLLKGAGFPVKDVSKVMKNTLKISSETSTRQRTQYSGHIPQCSGQRWCCIQLHPGVRGIGPEVGANLLHERT